MHTSRTGGLSANVKQAETLQGNPLDDSVVTPRYKHKILIELRKVTYQQDSPHSKMNRPAYSQLLQLYENIPGTYYRLK
uniref:Uncharacterized protein n=1 Tax=Glossina palpalis gambiensis TaxID=67801 RepID=A0A1B0B3V9_9MUSC